MTVSFNGFLKPPAQLSVPLHVLYITARWSASHAHIMFTLAFSERKSRTDLIEAAYVKQGQVQQHCLLDINLWSHCFDTRRSVQATVTLLLPSTLIHAWRWQHLSSKKPFRHSVSHLSFFKLTCHSSLLSIQFFPMDFSVSLSFLVHIDRSPAENSNTVLTKVSAVLIWFISLYYVRY